ncbi:MAG: OmpA family protein [Bacteroidetes bacterium]|nr:OmpA family protein [Bacteroidota bacterium]
MKYLLTILIVFLTLTVIAQEKTFKLTDKSFELGSVYEVQLSFYNLCLNYEDSLALEELYNAMLDSLTYFFNSNPNLRIEIGSHTDQRGGAEYNLQLSNKQAKHLRSLLVERGVKKNRLVTKGYGETKPLVDQVAIDKLETNNEKVMAYSSNMRFELKILRIK